jgi:archaellum component FlaC
LETDREKDLETHNKRFERHDEKLDSVKAEVSGLSLLMAGIDAKLDSVKEAVDRNANLYVARRKQHIHDTGGEPED